MIFDYIALNKSNNKVEGEITADNIDDARTSLHGMGLTVLAVNERAEEVKVEKKEEKEEKEEKDYISFEFKGIDNKGKEIIGTIDAKDSLGAYIRLKNEFLFDVKYLFDLSADETEKEKQKNDLAKDLQQKYELTSFADKEKEEEKESDRLEEIEKANVEKLDILRNQINVMIAQIKTVLGKIEDKPANREEMSQIKTLIAELERVKMSNNIKHIKSVAERILDIAESLLKGKEEYKVVIKQKEGLKSLDLDKLQNMQNREASEIKGISGALDKVSQLFKKYVGKIGVNLEKKEKVIEKKVLTKELEASGVLVNEIDLAKKDKTEIKQNLKNNLKAIFSFKKDPKIDRRAAYLNSKLLLKAYLSRPKTEESEKEGDSGFMSTLKHLLKPREADATKKDYQKVFIDINNFIGWLLCFYLIYFFLGGLVLQKNISFLKTFFYKTVFSEFLIVLLFAFFIFHLLTNLKIKFFRQSFFGALFLICAGTFSVLLYALNF